MTNEKKEPSLEEQQTVKLIKVAQKALNAIDDNVLTSKQSRALISVLDSMELFLESLCYDGDN